MFFTYGLGSFRKPIKNYTDVSLLNDFGMMFSL